MGHKIFDLMNEARREMAEIPATKSGGRDGNKLSAAERKLARALVGAGMAEKKARSVAVRVAVSMRTVKK